MNALAITNSPSTAESIAPNLLPMSIGFFFAFRIFSVLIAVRGLGQDSQVGAGLGLIINYLLLVLVAFHSIGPAPRTLRSIMQIPCSRCVLFFLCFTGASLYWTISVSLPAACAFWLAMAADIAMIMLLVRLGPADTIVNALMKGYIWGASTVAAVAWMLPSQSDLRLGDEELLGPNQIGYVCAFAFFFAQYLTQRKNGSWSLHMFLLGVTLLRSLSKTTIIAFVAAQAYILLRDRSISRRARRTIALSALLTLVFFEPARQLLRRIHQCRQPVRDAHGTTRDLDLFS